MAVSKVELVILGLVAEEPRYGYEILERFRERAMGEWVEVGKASVYQALRRLEERRLVAGRSQEGDEGPDRRVYRITGAGRTGLRGGVLERLQGADPYETGAGVALGFAHLLVADDVGRGIDAREGALAARRTTLAEERSRMRAISTPGGAVAARLLELQDAFAKSELAWLASFRADLAKLRR